ncbi:MAG TPA: cation transporter [Bacteroidales bacterium]|nr:cation transporter [Bacteroidales bacterium]HRZ77875.1 cation transporter [Bacteroidales bacterium]
MKNLLPLFLILFLAACSNTSSQKDQGGDDHTIIAEHVKTLVLDVQGMTCNGCENTVQESVSSLAGITEVKASHTDSVAIVSFDPGQTSVEDIQEAITKVGYEVTGFHFQDEGK